MNMQKAIVLDRLARIMKYVVLTIGAFMVFFPFLWMLTTSLKTGAESIAIPPILFPEEPQWSNYEQAWKIVPWLLYFRNTLIVAVVGTLLTLIITILSAYGIIASRS